MGIFTAIMTAFLLGAHSGCIAPEYPTEYLSGYVLEYSPAEAEKVYELVEEPEYESADECAEIGDASPYWVDSEVRDGAVECGACGANVTEYQMVLSYDGSEWVEVCGSCYELFATESPEHRAYGESMVNEGR